MLNLGSMTDTLNNMKETAIDMTLEAANVKTEYDFKQNFKVGMTEVNKNLEEAVQYLGQYKDELLKITSENAERFKKLMDYYKHKNLLVCFWGCLVPPIIDQIAESIRNILEKWNVKFREAIVLSYEDKRDDVYEFTINVHLDLRKMITVSIEYFANGIPQNENSNLPLENPPENNPLMVAIQPKND